MHRAAIRRTILAALVVILGASTCFHEVLRAQTPSVYGDRWANSPWHGTFPFQYRWVTQGPGVYSQCTVQLRSSDNRDHVSDFEVLWSNGTSGDVQSGSVEDLAIGPQGLSQIMNIGDLEGRGCQTVISVTPLRVR
jgi:hypothetical protein